LCFCILYFFVFFVFLVELLMRPQLTLTILVNHDILVNNHRRGRVQCQQHLGSPHTVVVQLLTVIIILLHRVIQHLIWRHHILNHIVTLIFLGDGIVIKSDNLPLTILIHHGLQVINNLLRNSALNRARHHGCEKICLLIEQIIRLYVCNYNSN